MTDIYELEPCPHCGELINVNAIRCRHCGLDTRLIIALSDEAPPELDEEPAESRGRWLLPMMIAVIAGVFLCGGAIVLMARLRAQFDDFIPEQIAALIGSDSPATEEVSEEPANDEMIETPTVTPVPLPTATPIPTFTGEEAYLSDMYPIVVALAFDLDAATRLFNEVVDDPYVIYEDEWRLSLADHALSLGEIRDRLNALSPPPTLEPAHTALIDGITACQSAMTMVNEAAEANVAGEGEQAQTLMTEARLDMIRCDDQMLEAKGAVGGYNEIIAEDIPLFDYDLAIVELPDVP